MEHTVYELGDVVEYIRRHYVVEYSNPVTTHEEGVVTNISLYDGWPIYRINDRWVNHKDIIRKIRREDVKESKYKVGDWVTYRDSKNHYQFGYGQITDAVMFCSCSRNGQTYDWEYNWEYKINEEYIKEKDIDMQAEFYRTTSTPTMVVTSDSVTIGRPRKAVMPGIKDVIFNDPATILIFDDDTKSVVKATGDDMYCAEIGYLMALVKKLVNNKDYDTILKTMDKYNQKYREQCSTDTKK